MVESHGKCSFYLHNTSASVHQKTFQKLQSVSYFYCPDSYLIENLDHAVQSSLAKNVLMKASYRRLLGYKVTH